MKPSKFTEQQIVFALQQAENGVKVPEVCRKMGIHEATFYNWKKKYDPFRFPTSNIDLSNFEWQHIHSNQSAMLPMAIEYR